MVGGFAWLNRPLTFQSSGPARKAAQAAHFHVSPMPTLVIVLALVGLAGIIAGGAALWKNWQRAKSTRAPHSLRRWVWVCLLLGVLLGAASWPLTFWMGYPIHVDAEVGRVVGFPFFVAYFDSEGRDYVGVLTMPGVVANCLFWFLLPQLVVYLFARKSASEHGIA